MMEFLPVLSRIEQCIHGRNDRAMPHSIFGDILTYAGLLFSNWASWLTGGIVAAIFALWER
jgi:hypothetical protein